MDRFDLLSICKSVQRDLDVWTEAISGIEARELDGQFLRGVYTGLSNINYYICSLTGFVVLHSLIIGEIRSFDATAIVFPWQSFIFEIERKDIATTQIYNNREPQKS